MDIKGFKAKDGTKYKYDYEHLANRPEADQESDGGYYTPALTQPDENTLQFEFIPSQADMPSVEPVRVTIPAADSGANASYDEATGELTISSSAVSYDDATGELTI